MQPVSTISTVWNSPKAPEKFGSGVSLHSHTSMSEESLMFIHKMFAFLPGLKHLFEYYEHRSQLHGFKLDFVRANWRPPLVPRMAYDLEAGQIMKIGLQPLVSITDHDNIEAPLLLRQLPSSRGIPFSTEWSAPFGATEFHLGVHNLPSAESAWWMKRLDEYTNNPGDQKLVKLLAELDEIPGVLLVLNHPLWDLYKIGQELHERELSRFLECAGQYMHALELNGLRDARENRKIVQMGRDTGHLLISGGDRHSLEPNACINLSQATNFREFVDEVRIDRVSNVLFMEQYAKPWNQRILHSTLDAVTDFPQFTEGWQRWDERCYHPDRDGVLRPLSELWVGGRAPLPLRASVELVRLARSRTFTKGFNMAFTSIDAQAEMELL